MAFDRITKLDDITTVVVLAVHEVDRAMGIYHGDELHMMVQVLTTVLVRHDTQADEMMRTIGVDRDTELVAVTVFGNSLILPLSEIDPSGLVLPEIQREGL